ncbi:MAG TPA: ribonuclease HII [Peptococcaceae bacterium]|nr:ribonuclease HII [Peptococcaceae bacterium]
MDESTRISNLLQIESMLYQEGYNLIAGVDEAGRGPLAGPVVAAACILPRKIDLPGLNDSKKLTQKKREELFSKIKEQALAYSIGSASPEEIDQLNILQATKLAMKRALAKLTLSPDYVLIDGRDELAISIPQKAVIDGDALSASIAAASILAKVTRDEFMCKMHKLYPEYSFDLHKGYPTRLHLEALKKFGPCPLHRRSFSPLKEKATASGELG